MISGQPDIPVGVFIVLCEKKITSAKLFWVKFNLNILIVVLVIFLNIPTNQQRHLS